MKKFRVHLGQVGHGVLSAVVEVEAPDEQEARELAYEADIKWRVAKFSGEGIDIHDVEELT